MRTVYLLQLVVPLALIAWLFVPAARSKLALWTRIVTIGLALGAIGLRGLWLFPPWWFPWACAAAFALMAAGTLIRHRGIACWPTTRREAVLIGLLAVLGGYAALQLVLAAHGRKPPPIPPLALEWPLRGGAFLIVNGGSDIRINAHLKTREADEPRFARWRGNGHALDIVAIDRLGRRAQGIQPRDNLAYRTYGWPVASPCTGEVLYVVDGRPDRTPPAVDDRAHLAGNYVLLACGGIQVVLAHLQPRSVRVVVGQAVRSGEILGIAGNSGVSDEAHLHVHAQLPGTADAPMSGQPVPMSFDGRFLVRGDRVTADRRGVIEVAGTGLGLIALLALPVVCGLALAVASFAGRRASRKRTTQLRRNLESAAAPIAPHEVDLSRLAGLPAPVRRYLGAALSDGQPMIRGVRIEHRGTFNLAEETSRWKPFESDQQVVTRRPGFDWYGTIEYCPGVAVHVHDAYIAGEGILHASLMGLVPVARLCDRGDLARDELLRFLAESVWYPTVLLPGQGVTWKAIDEQSAEATLTDGDVAASLVFSFGPDDLVRSVSTEARGRRVRGAVHATPWQGRFWGYERRHGMRVPVDGEVAWVVRGDYRPYWRGRVVRMEFEFTNPRAVDPPGAA